MRVRCTGDSASSTSKTLEGAQLGSGQVELPADAAPFGRGWRDGWARWTQPESCLGTRRRAPGYTIAATSPHLPVLSLPPPPPHRERERERGRGCCCDDHMLVTRGYMRALYLLLYSLPTLATGPNQLPKDPVSSLWQPLAHVPMSPPRLSSFHSTWLTTFPQRATPPLARSPHHSTPTSTGHHLGM